MADINVLINVDVSAVLNDPSSINQSVTLMGSQLGDGPSIQGDSSTFEINAYPGQTISFTIFSTNVPGNSEPADLRSITKVSGNDSFSTYPSRKNEFIGTASANIGDEKFNINFAIGRKPFTLDPILKNKQP